MQAITERGAEERAPWSRSFFEGKRSELAPFTTEEQKRERAHLIRYGVRERWINLPSAPRSSPTKWASKNYLTTRRRGYVLLDRYQLVSVISNRGHYGIFRSNIFSRQSGAKKNLRKLERSGQLKEWSRDKIWWIFRKKIPKLKIPSIAFVLASPGSIWISTSQLQWNFQGKIQYR